MSVQISQCLKIIEILADYDGGLAIREIATAADLTKSSAHRILAALVHDNYVIQDANSQDYILSSKLPLLGLRHSRSRMAVREIQPIIDRLALLCEELVQVALYVSPGLFWIAAAEGTKRGLRFQSNIGGRAQLTPTAVGQALLSQLPEEDGMRLVLTEGFGDESNLGPNAPRDLKVLQTNLTQAREDGYAVAIDSAELGVSAVACAVLSPDQTRVIGTLGIGAPTARKGKAELHSFGKLFVAEASKISVPLDYALASSDVGGTVISDLSGGYHRTTVATLGG